MLKLSKVEVEALETIHRARPEHLKALMDLIDKEAATNPLYKDRIYHSAQGKTAAAVIKLLFYTANLKYTQEELENTTDYIYHEWRASRERESAKP